MARSYAQVKVAIWDDDSAFCRLGPNAKLLYIHLISRRDLSLAGHLFIREQRWADACFGGNVDAVTDAMTELMTDRYVIVDAKTGELLVRTFIRHDGGYRNSKMRKAIEGAIAKIESPQLSTAATAELARCVNGDPEPPNDHVEDQSDNQSDDTSGQTSDETTDPTYSLRPAALDLQPYNASSSSSDSGSAMDNSEDDDERMDSSSPVRTALAVVAERLAQRNANGDAHSYKHAVEHDQTRLAALADLHALAPDLDADALAHWHLTGRKPRPPQPPPEPEPEREIIPREPTNVCNACAARCTEIDTAGACRLPNPPKFGTCYATTGEHVVEMRDPEPYIATVHPIRGESA